MLATGKIIVPDRVVCKEERLVYDSRIGGHNLWNVISSLNHYLEKFIIKLEAYQSVDSLVTF